MHIQCKSSRQTRLKPGNCRIEPLESRRLLSWTTVDDYQLAPGFAAGLGEMTADAAGNVYAVGIAGAADGTWHGVVRQKLAGSETWETVLDLPPSGSSSVEFRHVAASLDGDLYVVGNYGNTFTILERQAGESSFAVVDQVAGYTYEGGLTIDSAGNVYALHEVYTTITTNGPGKKKTTTSGYVRTIRKQTGGTGAFVAMPYQFPTFISAMASINSGPSAGLYAVGGAGAANWSVFKSTDAAVTWTQVDSFQLESGMYSDAHGVSGDLDGNVYVTGTAARKVRTGNSPPAYTTIGYLTTRKSSNGGATWTVDETFALDGTAARGAETGIDAAGNLHVVGYARDAAGVYHNLVRQKLRGQAGWSTVDDFVGPYPYPEWMGFAADLDGNIFAGYGGDTWIVRSEAPAATAQSGGGETAGSIFADSRIADADDDTLAELV